MKAPSVGCVENGRGPLSRMSHEPLGNTRDYRPFFDNFYKKLKENVNTKLNEENKNLVRIKLAAKENIR